MLKALFALASSSIVVQFRLTIPYRGEAARARAFLGPLGVCGRLADTQDLDARRCHGMIVLDRAAADSDCSDQHAVLIHNRQAARKGDQAFIGMLDALERFAWLRQLAELSGCHAEEAIGLRLLDGDVDGTNPGVVHLAPESITAMHICVFSSMAFLCAAGRGPQFSDQRQDVGKARARRRGCLHEAACRTCWLESTEALPSPPVPLSSEPSRL
jgi:hypothetical protein